MRAVFATTLAVLCVACIDLSLGKGKSEEASDQPADEDGELEAGLRLEGLGCGTDARTGITLCLGVNVCPGQVIDKDLWPGCGYRVGPAGFDLQCVCEDALCPIGTPQRCEDIQRLLEEQSQMVVCARQAEGLCIFPQGGGGTSGTNGGCDRECAKNCGGENGCLEQCGCTG